MSVKRKQYIARLVCRCLIFIAGLYCCFAYPQVFDILEGNNFFGSFSVMHLLWVVWMVDMFLQIVPIKNQVPLGSQKLFANRFRPILDKWNYENLRSYVISTTKAAYKVFVIYAAMIAAIGFLYHVGVIGRGHVGGNRSSYLTGCYHMYKYTLKNPSANIMVKAIDRFGNVYTETKITEGTDYSITGL